MKRLFILLAVLICSGAAFAADVKVSALTEMTTPTDDDLAMIVDGSTSKKITWANIKATLLASPTFTGIITFPIASDPTTDADGEMSFDTDGWGSGYDALEIWNGTASAYVVATTASDTPTNGQVPKWNTGGTITWEDDSGGIPTTITVADTTDATAFFAFFDSATGDLGPKTDAGAIYNASTGDIVFTGDITAASFTAAKASGVAGDVGLYEANSTDTDAAGFRGPASMTGDTSYRGQFNNAGPSSANMVQAWAASGSGDGTAASPYIHALSWIDLDNYMPITGSTNLATTGTIQGGIKISSDADGMDASAMTAAGMYGTMFIATGAGTWTLPSGALGMSGCLMDSGTAHDLILDVTAGDTMRLKGTEQADGVGITNASGTSTGDFICFVCVATNKWSTVGAQGTWASQ